MRERGILFKDRLVLDILEDRKTVTRRIITNVGPDFHERARLLHMDPVHGVATFGDNIPDDPCPLDVRCLHGAEGDRLYVREAFYCDDYRYPDAPVEEMLPLLEYRATHNCASWESGCPCSDENNRSNWRPSIHMFRWASRIDLEIVSVRAERLQDITPNDARAEGVTDCTEAKRNPRACPAPYRVSWERPQFSLLWDSINARRGYGWERNPWVWRIEFRRLRR